MRIGFSKSVKEREVIVQCPYAKSYTKDFCDPKHPFRINLASANAHDIMNVHIEMHVERNSSVLGLTVKRIGCQVCDWTSKPFGSNNAMTISAISQEEADGIMEYESHMADHEKCDRHTTTGQQPLVYYFKNDDEKKLHSALLHAPKVKPKNVPRVRLGADPRKFR
jgi:hypothetical protein